MRKTIKDVAKNANVSTATVSLVISGNRRISGATRKRVLQSIEDLNYHPSRSARGLVSKKTGNIGFVLTENHFLRTEPFYTKIFLGAEFESRKFPYYILLSTIPSDARDLLPRFVEERSIDALIVAGTVSDKFISNLEKYRYPVVYIDFYPGEGDYSAVLIDNIDGARQAVQHLIDCGHRNIAFLGGEINHPSINERFLGYRMTLEKNNIPFNPDNVVTTKKPINKEEGYLAAANLLKSTTGVTAIFSCNDAMAIGAMQLLKERNISIPKDVSVVGFDDIESDLFMDPPLTTIRVPKFDLGIEALRLICDMNDKKLTDPKKILMPVELVVRRSTCKLQEEVKKPQIK